MKTIVLTGGGTAGHTLGCLALVEELTKHFDKIFYVGSQNGIEKNLVKKYKEIVYIPIPTTKLIRGFCFKNFLIPFKLLRSIKECKKMLKDIKPNIIFSKGGYVSVPVCFAAHSLDIPIVLHESDITLGLANKLIKNKTKAICTSFDVTAQKLKNGIHSGSPILNNTISNKNILLNNPQNLPVLLVLGGSLGASSLNKLVYDNLNFLCENFFVVHITGKGKRKDISHKNYLQIEFCDEIQKLYSISNYALTRGGSNTLFELLGHQIPMLIAPLKKQTRGEQKLNANYFEKKGYALVLEEETQNELKNKLKLLIKNSKIIKQKMDKYPHINSTNIIVNLLKRFAK